MNFHFADTPIEVFETIIANPELHGHWFIRASNRWHKSLRLENNRIAIAQCTQDPTRNLEIQSNIQNNFKISINTYNHIRI